jgi:hypothetical protein
MASIYAFKNLASLLYNVSMFPGGKGNLIARVPDDDDDVYFKKITTRLSKI